MPNPKRYRVRTGARAAPKVKEKELIKKAKKLMKNPELILPRCEGNCRRCPFDRSRKQIERIQDIADNEKLLTPYASRGDDLARAYAATLLLAHAEKAPYLAAIKLPTGDVSFAVRGKAKRNQLIGVQHYDDPMLRLFGIIDLVRKRRLFVYSDENEMVCTGTVPNPPKSFVLYSIQNLKAKLAKAGHFYHCPHLRPKDMDTGSGASNPYLRIEWVSAEVVIGICERCARSTQEHSLSVLASKIAAKKPMDDFEVSAIFQPACQLPDEKCLIDDPPEISEELIEQYRNGEISDIQLLEKHQKILMDEYYTDKRVIILDNKCYGTNADLAIRSLQPTEGEQKALKVLFENTEKAIVMDKASPNKLMSAYWDEFGEAMLTAVTGKENKAFTHEFLESVDMSKTNPSQVLKDAVSALKHTEILDALPNYTSLPAIAAFADKITRIYLTKGAEETIRAIDRYKGKDTKIKSVAYAILLALNKAASKRWQYTTTEADFAQFLKEYAKNLLYADPENYHEALQQLLSATGSTERIKKNG